MRLPTLLSLSRIAGVPLLLGLTLLQGSCAALALLFVVVAMTDALDGYFARRWNQTTPWGHCLDHTADKVWVAAGLFCSLYLNLSSIVLIPTLFLVVRDLCVSGLREAYASMTQGETLRVRPLGRVKTLLEMVAAALLLLPQVWGGWFLGVTLLYGALCCGLITFWQYSAQLLQRSRPSIDS